MRLANVFSVSAAFGLALGAAALLLPGAARAADDEVSIDQKFMQSIMDGLGLKRDGEATINYQERAPLVLPPSRELPPPEQVDAATANNPAWPKDPDVARRKAEAAAEKNRNVSDEREREQNPLRPDQLTPGGRAKRKSRRVPMTAMSRRPPVSAINCCRLNLAPLTPPSSELDVWREKGRNGKIHRRTASLLAD